MSDDQLFEKLEALYTALNAIKGEKGPKGKTIRVQRTKVFDTLGISRGYYTILYSNLEDMGCIEHVSRGTQGRPSEMILYHPPKIEQYDPKRARSRLTTRSKSANLSQRVTILERRLEGVDLKEAIVALDKRIRALESK
jgi:hypothetical protein